MKVDAAQCGDGQNWFFEDLASGHGDDEVRSNLVGQNRNKPRLIDTVWPVSRQVVTSSNIRRRIRASQWTPAIQSVRGFCPDEAQGQPNEVYRAIKLVQPVRRSAQLLVERRQYDDCADIPLPGSTKCIERRWKVKRIFLRDYGDSNL